MIVGDKAPDLLGIDQNGKEIYLSDYKGRKLVLYFYPKDMTSGCTAQHVTCVIITMNCARRVMKW